MKDVIELAKQAGFDTINDKVYVWAGQHYISVELELYTKLVRNAALEKAMAKVTKNQILSVVAATECLAIIESLKEPTP